MSITIIGDPSYIHRVETGYWSFDRACTNRKGDIGFPVGVGIEIFGSTNTGKSTVTYGLAGILARGKNIALADFEGFDPDFLVSVLETSGFSGEVNYIQRKEDEDALDELLICLKKKDYSVGILDSIGAISPVAEQQGELGERNMGQRAFLMAQFTRKALPLFRSDDPPTIFMINHAYPKIGGRGMDTPGGEVKKYLASIRIQMRRKFIKGKYEEFPDGSYIIEGTVVKNRWGYKDRKFNLFVLAGAGIHKGLTAMYDGIMLGIVDRKRTIKIGDQSFGFLKDVVQEAHNGNNEFFTPFLSALYETNPEIVMDEEEKESEEQEDNEKEFAE